MNAKQATLNNGGGSIPSPAYLYNEVIQNAKVLKAGANITMSTDNSNDIIPASAPDVYNKTEVARPIRAQ